MCWCDGLGPKEPSLESGLNVPRVGLEPENDAEDDEPDEVDQEGEEACLSNVFEASIISTLHCNQFTS